MSTTLTGQDFEEQLGSLAERLFLGGIAAFEHMTIHLGRTLGLYDVLLRHEASTASDLATHADIHSRYAREWLEQQAVAGLIDVDDVDAEPEARRYTLPAPHVEVLVNPESLAYLAPLSGFIVALGEVAPALVDAYRTGGGIEFGDFGPNVRDNQGAFNRPGFVNQLASEWLAEGMPDVHAALTAGARVLDVGCGVGWSTVALAKAYPDTTIVGVDLDAPGIEAARRLAKDAGVDDRVTFEVRDATDLDGQYDVTFVFEALHDMPHPIEVLAAIRQVTTGPLIIMDERTAEAFTAPGDEVERFLYAASVLHCLPVGMSQPDSAATGTVMRPTTLRHYGTQAGYDLIEVLPIEHDFFRFYRLEVAS